MSACVPMPDVQGRCPACGGASLFLGSGGHVTCSRIDCPAPDTGDMLLHGGETALVVALGGDRKARVVAHTLHFHGHSIFDVHQMTDEQFLAVPGIGDTSLARIRAAIPGPDLAAPGPIGAALAALEALARKIPTIITEAMDQDRYTLAPPAADLRSRLTDAVRSTLHQDLPGDMAEHVTEAVLTALQDGSTSEEAS